MIKGVYGMNIAVKDLDAAVKKYTDMLGQKPVRLLGDGDFAFPGLRGAAFDINGFILHLITGEENTSVGKFVSSKGEGVFLLSLRSDNVEGDMGKMTEAGAIFVMDKPLKGGFGTANFIHPKSTNGIQIEVYDPEAKA
jgi:catechol 2,3-dioxygenase-like lactoylglutathione lyase family enzyme